MKTPWVGVAFRCFHLGLTVFMTATAALALAADTDIKDTDAIFVAFYIFVFAVILFVFEASQFTQISFLDLAFRQNFGFLFKPLSKAIFIIFIGFLFFGLKGDRALKYACGIVTIADGVVLAGVYCKDPSLLVVEPDSYTPPTVRTEEV